VEKLFRPEILFPSDGSSGISPLSEQNSTWAAGSPTGTGKKKMSSPSLRAVPLDGARGVLVRPKPGVPLPPDFVPLRLVLIPSGYSVEIRRIDTLLGRHTAADIRVPLPDVSRQHCRFLWLAGSWKVIDLKSLNGVRVNGVSVPQAVLHEGDELRIGGFTFRVEMVSAAAADEPIHPRFPTESPEEDRRLAG
jgi:hypothetical protein